MSNLFICKTFRSLGILLAAVAVASSIAQTPSGKLPGQAVTIKPGEWTGNLAPSLGSNSSPIKVVFFVDYQCPSCRSADPIVRRVLSKHPDVALTYREFPLPMHSLAKPAAIVAENARAHGTFEIAHKRLMEGQTLTEAAVKDAARKAGVSTTESSATSLHIEADHALGHRGSIFSVPSFVVIENGRSAVMSKQQFLDRFK